MTVRKPKLFYGYVIVAASFVIMAVASGGFNTFGVFFGPMLEEFGWSRALTSGAFSVALVLSGLLGLVTGRLTDRFGPRLVLTGCGLLLGLAFFLMSQVSSSWQLYLYYGVIAGIGMSGHFVPLLSTVARWFDKRLGAMSGIVLAGVGTGVTLMPMLANWGITDYGWRRAFMVFGLVGVVYVIAAQLLHRDPHSRGLLPFGQTQRQQARHLDMHGLSFREALRTRQLWMLFGAIFCLGFCFHVVMVHIVIYATGLGIPAAGAVRILSFLGMANIVGRILMGHIGDRIGHRQVLLMSISLLFGSLVGLQFARELWMLYLFGAVFGYAYAGTFVPTSPLIAEFFGLKNHGVLFGVIDAAFLLGGTAGPVLVGYTYDVTGSYRTGLLILAVVSLVGVVLAILLKSVQIRPNSTPAAS
ncbi:MAG: MFS transporter [Chloroflexi bacterium]|nr:MFS transporter [Chloroflexota bacterium]